MDASIFVEAWREGIKYSMRREPFWKKAIISLGGFITLVLCSLVGAYYMSYWSNVLQFEDNEAAIKRFNQTDFMNSTYYDINWINRTYYFTDNETAD